MLRKTGIHLILIPFIAMIIVYYVLPHPEPPTNIEDEVKPTGLPLIGVYYYLWIGNMVVRTVLGTGTTQPIIRSSGGTASFNESFINWQLDRIQELGIDFMFISWWGEGSGGACQRLKPQATRNPHASRGVT